MVTLKEIAQKCNVSVATVSNVLNGKPKVSEETKKLIEKTMEELGYYPNYAAQALRGQKTYAIGVIVDDIGLFTMPKAIESIMEHCEAEGYRTVIQNLRLFARWDDTWYNQQEAYRSILEQALNELLSIKVDGIIYVASHARKIRCFPENFPIPVIFVNAYMEEGTVPTISVDDQKGAYDLTKYLIGMGHKKIGIIAGLADNMHVQQRLLGYQKALFEEGILFNPAWIHYGKWERKTGYIHTGALLKEGVTAIFCMADQMAGGVYDYLEEHQLKVAEDMSVVGFDNQIISEFFRPALTTIDLPIAETSEEVVKLLLAMIDQDEAQIEEIQKERIRLRPCHMIIRNSVKRLE